MHLSCTLANSNIVVEFSKLSAKFFSCTVANSSVLIATSLTLVVFWEMFSPIIILVLLTLFSDKLLSWSHLSNLSAKKVSIDFKLLTTSFISDFKPESSDLELVASFSNWRALSLIFSSKIWEWVFNASLISDFKFDNWSALLLNFSPKTCDWLFNASLVSDFKFDGFFTSDIKSNTSDFESVISCLTCGILSISTFSVSIFLVSYCKLDNSDFEYVISCLSWSTLSTSTFSISDSKLDNSDFGLTFLSGIILLRVALTVTSILLSSWLSLICFKKYSSYTYVLSQDWQ